MRRQRPLLIDMIPPPQAVAIRLGDALREVELLRRLQRLADIAEEYRECDRQRQNSRTAAEEDATHVE